MLWQRFELILGQEYVRFSVFVLVVALHGFGVAWQHYHPVVVILDSDEALTLEQTTALKVFWRWILMASDNLKQAARTASGRAIASVHGLFRYSAAFLIHRQPAGTVRLVARNFSDLEDSFRMQGIGADEKLFDIHRIECGMGFSSGFTQLFSQSPAGFTGNQDAALRQHLQASAHNCPGAHSQHVDFHQLLAAAVSLADRSEYSFIKLVVVHIAFSNSKLTTCQRFTKGTFGILCGRFNHSQ